MQSNNSYFTTSGPGALCNRRVHITSVYVESKHAIQKTRGRPRTFTFTGGEAKAGKATELLAFVPVLSEEPVVEEQGLVSGMVQ